MTWKAYDPVERMPFLYEGTVPTEGTIIPTTDEVAWEHWTHHRWVYNRLEIAVPFIEYDTELMLLFAIFT